jgi:hypothetical protein
MNPDAPSVAQGLDLDLDEARAKLATTTTGWEKSTFSGGQNGCFEFHFGLPGWVGVRDSKLGAGSPVLVFNETEFDAMQDGVRAGQFKHRIQ